MKKKRLEIVIAIILIFIFFLALSNVFKGLKNKNTKKQAPMITAASVSLQTSNKVPLNGPAGSLEWARCPFSGNIYRSQVEEAGMLKLDGIIWDDQEPLAMINGHILRTGENIDNNKVISISRDSVILHDGSQNIELKLE